MRKNKNLPKLSSEREKRFSKAKKEFEKLQKEIAPFVKHRKLVQHSTAGEWHEVSSYIF